MTRIPRIARRKNLPFNQNQENPVIQKILIQTKTNRLSTQNHLITKIILIKVQTKNKLHFNQNHVIIKITKILPAAAGTVLTKIMLSE